MPLARIFVAGMISHRRRQVFSAQPCQTRRCAAEVRPERSIEVEGRPIALEVQVTHVRLTLSNDLKGGRPECPRGGRRIKIFST